jgi:hypothetical protein
MIFSKSEHTVVCLCYDLNGRTEPKREDEEKYIAFMREVQERFDVYSRRDLILIRQVHARANFYSTLTVLENNACI